MNDRSEYANAVVKEFEQLATNRGNEESHWQEISSRIYPAHSRLFQGYGNQTTGEKRTEELFDSTASIALKRFGAILDSLLTPRNQTWHRLVPSDKKLLKNRQAVMWFEEVNRLLLKYRYTPQANFSAQNYQNYLSLGAYGTGCVFIDQMAGSPGIRYKNVHLSEVFFVENHQGIIDKAYRRFWMTARQINQKWKSKIPDNVKAKLATDPESKFEVIHKVGPNEDFQYGRLDHKGMEISSCYILKEGRAILEEGGYTSFPYAISRYEQITGENYGRGPAADVLPAVKTLNEQKKTVLKQGHRSVDPVLLAHDDGVLDGFSMKPGALNTGGVSADGRPLVHALPVGNIAIGKDLMDDEKAVINDAFLVTLFQILLETPEMTATEVLERTREKGILLAPTVGRQNSEYLGPMINRELDVLSYQELLPPMPQVLVEARGQYEIVYDSPISRAQRAEEAAGLQRSIQHTLEIVNVTQDPSLLYHYNFNEIIPEMAAIQGVPLKWMNDPKVVAQMKQQQMQAQEEQAMIQAAPAAAALTKAQAVASKARG